MQVVITMSMQTATSRVPEMLAILDSLETGERRLLDDVSWEDYEQLLEDLGGGYAARIYYIEQNRLKGDIAAANSFRKWARARKSET